MWSSESYETKESCMDLKKRGPARVYLSKRKDLSEFEKYLVGRKRKTNMLCEKRYNMLHKKKVCFKV